MFEFRKVVSKRETCFRLVPEDYPVIITKETISSDSIKLEGHFTTPFEQYLPGLLPKASETAFFQVLLPRKWQSEHFKPVCLHLAGTGDHVSRILTDELTRTVKSRMFEKIKTITFLVFPRKYALPGQVYSRYRIP